jgi:hypothetical protein
MLKAIVTTIALTAVVTFCGQTANAKDKETEGRVDTQIRSYVDAATKGKRYKNLVVSVPVENMVFRGDMEDALADELSSDRVVAIQFTKLFPPTRQYSESEIRGVISDYDFSAILIISVTSDQLKDVGIASTSTARTSGSAATSIFNTAGYGGYKGSVYAPAIAVSSGGAKTTENSISRRLEGRDITLSATLYDIGTQKNVWVASLTSHVEEGSNRESKKLLSEKKVAGNIADKISSAMKSDEVLQEKHR